MLPPSAEQALLAWYVAIGADEAIEPAPRDRLAEPPPKPALAPTQPRAAPRPAAASVQAQAVRTPAIEAVGAEGVALARAAAAAATTLAELEAAVRSFTGCALKSTASRTVFADGNPAAALMILGEGPGGEEDRLGLPFVGPSGKLLDRMLAAIGRDRTSAYISNVVFWRPPGNRKPSPIELAQCLPFVERHIALVAPSVLLLAGDTAAKTLLQRSEGITRMRGRWAEYRAAPEAENIPTLPTYHPSYLLRSSAQKRDSWHDFLQIQVKLEEMLKLR
jgi:uracil-DNA glycosylase family 4